jgi:4-amino-4-deoxy-L-arabinose transferase-like glycosyltransferase
MSLATIGTMRAGSDANILRGLIAFLISLLGTLLLGDDVARPWGVLLLITAAVLTVIIWGRQPWIPAFAVEPVSRLPSSSGLRSFYLFGATGAFLIVLVADLRYLTAPSEAFGLAGILWLIGVGVLLCSVLAKSDSARAYLDGLHSNPWTTCEIVVIAGLTFAALLTRVWRLSSFPDNIYPDEIMTGTIATQSYLGPHTDHPSVFSTVWSGIDLPALWFWLVSLSLKVGGTTLAALRLPSALFGAATVLPLYGLIRGTWGKYAAIAGATILAFSASNVHYSRLAINNITTQFFWAMCFFFALRGLRSHRPLDWMLTGLSAGLSEYFYYGTRLLPFILLVFIGYLLAVHRQQARSYLSDFALLAGSYFVGFGPLLCHFIRHPNLYLGRGVSLLVWSPHVPTSLRDLDSFWQTVWPVISENLLGISTHSSQDIIFYAPLLLPAEAALLVLGVALLLWHWRHPAAFLMLISGLGVLLVGGALVAFPNSVPPLINHWTPAFPVFYAALAVPIGAWAASGEAELPVRLRWALPAMLATGLAVLGWLNFHFYFHRYYADPENLKSKAYKSAQRSYEVQTAQGRFQASLGLGYRVFTVGRNGPPYDPATTRYLAPGQEWTLLPNPTEELLSINPGKKGLAFLFFTGDDQYREIARQLYPGGTDGEVTNRRGKHLFYTYVITRAHVQAIQK